MVQDKKNIDMVKHLMTGRKDSWENGDSQKDDIKTPTLIK